MRFTEYEEKVLSNIEKEISETDNRDTINKIYRQARIWVRIHWKYGEACSDLHAKDFNARLKDIRWTRLEQLGFVTVRTINKED